MVMMAGMELPEKAIREQVAGAVHLIVQLSRMADGTRKVIEITEVQGIKNGEVVLAPIFEYCQSGMKDGKVQGNFTATGALPSFYGEIETHGLSLDKAIFCKGGAK
jgi:pilus assembly protein CpaF